MHRLETNVSSVSYLSVVFRSKKKIKMVILIFLLNMGSRLIISIPICIFLTVKCFHLYCLTPSTVEVSKFETLNSYVICSTI